MLHHASLAVANLQQSGALYDSALGALGYRRVCEAQGFAGYGVEDGRDKFALMETGSATSSGVGSHLAFAAPSRAAVDAFHRAALQYGATGNGAPALRPQYGPEYYAAFVIDLDGNRIEAVYRP
jgi:catechol 2,3-dioxygenase-like lactoylglutathione lyase family enzyme